MKKWVALGLLLALAGGAMASDNQILEEGLNSRQLVNYAAGANAASGDEEGEDAEEFRLRAPTQQYARVFVFGNFGGANRGGDLEQFLNSLVDDGLLVRVAGNPTQRQEQEGAATDDNPFVKDDEQEARASDLDLPGLFHEDDHNWYGRDPKHPGTYYTQSKIPGYGRIIRDDPSAKKNQPRSQSYPLIGNEDSEETQLLRRSSNHHARKGATSFMRILPPLALATAGTILIEVVKGQPLMPNPSYLWEGGHFYHPTLFFPTAMFDTFNISQMINAWYSYYDPASGFVYESVLPRFFEVGSIVALWIPPVVVASGEVVRATCCKVREKTEREFMCRMAVKAGLVAVVTSGGIVCLSLSVLEMSTMFSFYSPKIIQQMNLTSAIELCKQNGLIGMAWQPDPWNFYQSLCDVSALADQAVPIASGLVWSYCERAITSISASDYAMILLPFVFIVMEWIYLIVWA